MRLCVCACVRACVLVCLDCDAFLRASSHGHAMGSDQRLSFCLQPSAQRSATFLFLISHRRWADPCQAARDYWDYNRPRGSQWPLWRSTVRRVLAVACGALFGACCLPRCLPCCQPGQCRVSRAAHAAPRLSRRVLSARALETVRSLLQQAVRDCNMPRAIAALRTAGVARRRGGVGARAAAIVK